MTERLSQAYHAAHLAFLRSDIVTSAALGESILDLLTEYTNAVVKAERDRAAEKQSRVLRWIVTAVPDENEGVRPLDDLLDRIQNKAREALEETK